MLHQLTLFRFQRSAAFLAFGAAVFSSTAGTAAEPSLQDLSAALQSLPPIVIYQTKEVVTLDPAGVIMDGGSTVPLFAAETLKKRITPQENR